MAASVLAAGLLALLPGSAAGLGTASPPAVSADPPAATVDVPSTIPAVPADTVEARVDTIPDPPRLTPYRGEEVRVTVTRSESVVREAPYALSVVDVDQETATELRLSVAEGLRAVPGVFVGERRNFALGDRLVMRGVGSRAQFGVRGIKVLADGVPLTMPDGQAVLENLDLASAERMEVIRGGASALYGNASGGVVSVRSGGFASESLTLRPRVLAGSEGLWTQEARAAGRVGQVDYLLQGQRVERDGFREHSSGETYRANLLLRRQFDDGTELRGVVNVFDMPWADNPGSLTREDARSDPRRARPFQVAQGTGKSVTQAQTGVTLTRPLGEAATLEATAWGIRRDLLNPIPDRIIDLGRLAGGVRTVLEGRSEVASRRLAWTAGFDAEIQRDDRLERENLGVGDGGGDARPGDVLLDQIERVGVAAPFVQLRYEPVRDLRFTAGARLDRYRFEADDRFLADGDDSGSRTLSQLSPSVGVTWNPLPPLGLYATWATAFETPTANELSNRPDGEGGMNPDLDPEIGRTLEAGVRGSVVAGRFSYDLSLYDATVEDALIPFEGAAGQVFFRNAGELSRRGVELALGWRPAERVQTRLSFTHQDFEFTDFVTEDDDFSGNREPGTPRNRLLLEMRHRIFPGGPVWEGRLTWVDAYPVNDANTVSNWSYRVADLRVSWPVRAGPWSLMPFLAVDNVFDERYNGSVVPNAFGERYFEPAPGRQIFGGLTVDLPPF